MDSKCQTMDAVSEWRVTSDPQKTYLGLAEVKWKKRYYNHKNSIQSQVIFTGDETFKLCMASEGQSGCNS